MFSTSYAQGSSPKNPLVLWKLSLSLAIESFLCEVKQQVVDVHLKPKPLLISYVVDDKSKVDIAEAADFLKKHLSLVGIPVTCCALTDAKTLEQALARHRFAIVLCTPAYARQVEVSPEIYAILDRFGQTQKNALQPLLCEGSFGETALRIVDGHYLIRAYKEVLSVDANRHPLQSLETFVDVFLMLSGQSGLGVLPDVLGLKDKVHLQAEEHYKALLLDFKTLQEQLTIDYLLSVDLEKTMDSHPFKSYLSHSLPVIQADLEPGFHPVLEPFLSPSSLAKTSLFLCASSADVQLSNLALSQHLQEQGMRVLTIDCARYAGRAAKDCVRLALNELKIRNRESVLSKPLVILLKGYQDLGAYDNLIVDNKLGAWPHLKVIVTCRADFFRFRGYLSCFLSNMSERRVEELVVYKVPGFASLEAKKASIPLIAPQVLDSVLDESLSPKALAQQEELGSFLGHLREAWIETGYLHSNPVQNAQVFISYAWESIEQGARARQQSHLLRLAQGLRTLGLRPWLDLEQMTGDIHEQMAGNIQDSEIALVMGTPLYQSRAAQDTNVQREYEALCKKEEQQAIKILLLQFLGSGTATAFPEALQHRTEIMNFQGIDQSEDYLYRMSDPHQGLVAKLLGIVTDPQKFALYQSLHTQFQEQLSLLPAKHLVVQANQSMIQSLDVDNRLKGLIQPFALKEEHLPLSTRFNLSAYLNHFLEKPHAKTLVLLGRAGSGKSLFALNMLKQLLEPWHAYRSFSEALPTWLPVYIPLRNYNQNPEHCLSEALKQQCGFNDSDIETLRTGLGKAQKVLFICDGYDELGAEVRPNLSHQLEHWPHAKLLVTARPEHFDKEHAAEQSLRPLNGSLDLVHVSPFIPDEIKRYVMHYEGNQRTDTYQTLEKLPGMMALLNNPFLLSMVLQSLPQLLEHHQLQPDQAITRSDIYEAFVQTWFLQETKGRELTIEACQAFSEGLAFELFKAGTLSPSPAHPSLWAFFEDEGHAAARDAAPLRLSAGEYSFIHKSIYEYLTCQYLWKSLQIHPRDCATLLDVYPTLEQTGILKFLLEKISEGCPTSWTVDQEIALGLSKLLFDMGRVFLKFGQYTEARIAFEFTLFLKEQHYGFDHPEIVVTLGLLGNAYHVLGDFAKERVLLERIPPILEYHYAPENPLLATVFTAVAMSYYELGDLIKAKTLLERALVIGERHYGSEHPMVATILISLGDVYSKLGDLNKEIALIQRALAIKQVHYGSHHPECAKMLMRLGKACSTDDPGVGKIFFELALGIQESHYGSEHHILCDVLGALAGTHGALGDLFQRKVLLERVMAIQESSYGPDEHIDEIAATLVNLANTYGALGDLSYQKVLLERALVMQEGCYGSCEHPKVAFTLRDLANTYGALGDVSYQKILLERALIIQEQCYSGCEHGDEVIATLVNLANTYGALGDPSYQRVLLERASVMQEKYYCFIMASFGHPNAQLPFNEKQKFRKRIGIVDGADVNIDGQINLPQEQREELIHKYNLSSDSVKNLEKGLRMASYNNYPEDILRFLRLGADVNAQGADSGKTGLHHATIRKNIECIKRLLEYGAHTDIIDLQGKTVLDYSRESADSEILNLYGLSEFSVSYEALQQNLASTNIQQKGREENSERCCFFFWKHRHISDVNLTRRERVRNHCLIN